MTNQQEPSTSGTEDAASEGDTTTEDESEILDAELVDDRDLEEIESQVLSEGTRTVFEERDEYLDSLRRLQAEFDNFRKRMARQQSESLERSTETLLTRLLPVLDALDLAVAHAPQPTDGDASATALVAISSLMNDVLAKEGLERIDTADVVFDPTVHDAVAHEESDDGQAGSGTSSSVSQVLRAGYQLKGKVLRPAMVKVRG